MPFGLVDINVSEEHTASIFRALCLQGVITQETSIGNFTARRNSNLI
jgi:hypothetical protein